MLAFSLDAEGLVAERVEALLDLSQKKKRGGGRAPHPLLSSYSARKEKPKVVSCSTASG